MEILQTVWAFLAPWMFTLPTKEMAEAYPVQHAEFWVYIILLIVSYILQVALAPKPVTPPPAALGDFDFPQAAEGTPQAVIFGDCWTASWMVLSIGNYRTKAIPSDSGGGS